MSEKHVCPVWIGYLLASPLRKLWQDPDKVLSPHVREGMRVLDFGSAMGFFTLPMARMVGAQGEVLAVDLQEKMLAKLMLRAEKAGVSERIRPIRCLDNSIGLEAFTGTVDFALAMAVVHEVPDPERLFAQLFAALKPGGALLVSEPAGHVTKENFEVTCRQAANAGFLERDRPNIRRSLSAVFEKPKA